MILLNCPAAVEHVVILRLILFGGELCLVKLEY